MTRPESKPGRLAAFTDGWWPVAIIAVLLGVVLYQRWQTTHPTHPARLQIGEQLPSLVLQNLEGATVPIEWSADTRPTAIYVFQPKCIWCSRNLDGLRRLLRNDSGYRFIGVSLTREGLQEYVDRNRLTLPVYYVPDMKRVSSLKVIVTPETIVVSTAGRVQNVWLGAYTGETAKEIEKLFGVTLPPVQTAASSVSE